ncbi:hypothetical protein LL972_03760 [Xanthomonas campestris pv. asclepiadis]|uniref:hypothetical protein n=1 Tax=Xanthomonas campestris TaxID=339 RepID=UPI001E3C26E3|nr:hypothetical protein [Xanthomonas campestris]MCC4615147.1 hypothetical protein [Xanthomonas campestris pv. asclepiadis]
MKLRVGVAVSTTVAGIERFNDCEVLPDVATGLSDECADRRMSTCGSVCVLRGIAALAVFTTRRDDGDRVIMPGGGACGPAA